MIDDDTEAERKSLDAELVRIEKTRTELGTPLDPFFEQQLAAREQAVNDRIEELDAALVCAPGQPKLDPAIQQAVDDAVARALGPLSQQLQKNADALPAFATKTEVAALKEQLLTELKAHREQAKGR